MNTINFELSKRLNDLGLLGNIETEYRITETGVIENNYTGIMKNFENYKTLTLEEAIRFLNKKINGGGLVIFIDEGDWCIEYSDNEFNSVTTTIINNTLLGRIEEQIEYLLDNNLLTNYEQH